MHFKVIYLLSPKSILFNCNFFTFSSSLKKSGLLLVLLFTFKISINAQEIKDSIYLKKLYQNSFKNGDSLLFYSNKLLSSKNDCTKYKALNYQAKGYYLNNDIKKAESISKTVLTKLNGKNNLCFILEKLSTYNRLFWIYKNLKLYNEAYKAALDRKKLSETLPEDIMYNAQKISVNHNLAVIKDIMGLHDEALKIFKENYKILPETYNELIEQKYYYDKKESSYFLTLNQTSTLNLIGETYLNSSKEATSKNLDSASYYFKKAYEIAKTFDPSHQNSETLYQLREAEVLVAKNEFKNSLDLVNKYSKNSKEFNTYQKINALKAICFYNLNIKDSTLFYSRKFLNNYNKEKYNKEKLIAIYDILSKQYYQSKKIDSAFKYSELTIAELNLFNENKSLVNKAHYLHNYNDINILNKNIINKERKKRFWFGVVAVLTMLVLIWIIYFYKSNKSRVEKELETLKEKNINAEKTDYNIDKKTEENILVGIAQFEKSKGFLDKNFTINRLAKKLDTNTSYLSFVFNKKYDQSFKQYITQLRIEYIISELKENTTLRNYTIKALAEEIGYTNASAFTRAFKKHTGITPSEYIKSLS